MHLALIFQGQYIFLHEALLEALMCPTTATAAKDFVDVYENMKEIDPKTRKKKIYSEFQVRQ